MIACNKHTQCMRSFVQGPTDVSNVINCMMQRGIIQKSTRGKYFTERTPLTRR